MPGIEVEALDPQVHYGVLGIHFPFERTPFGAVHTVLEGELVERLGLTSYGSLSITSRETYQLNGVWGPTVSDCDRLFVVSSGAFLAVVAKPGSGIGLTTKIKPIYGLFVPARYGVGLQTIYNNRSSHLVITRRLAKLTTLPTDLMEFASQWRSTEADPVMYEADPRLSHPSQ